jgi:hypothetical protein
VLVVGVGRQASGHAQPFDDLSDVWSWGVVLYGLLDRSKRRVAAEDEGPFAYWDEEAEAFFERIMRMPRDEAVEYLRRELGPRWSGLGGADNVIPVSERINLTRTGQKLARKVERRRA